MADYCKDALKKLKRKIVCSKDCPLYKNCPTIIISDAFDKAEAIVHEAKNKILEVEE